MKRTDVPDSVDPTSRLHLRPMVAAVAVSLVLALLVALSAASGSVAAQSAEEINRTFGGQEDEWGTSVVEMSEGRFAVAGSKRPFTTGSHDALLAKTDRKGRAKAVRVFDEPGMDRARSVIAPSDGGFVLAGSDDLSHPDDRDAWIAKTDLNGNVDFRSSLSGGRTDEANSVVEAPGGDYVVAGRTRSSAVGGGAWLVKTNDDGRELFNEAYRGAGGEESFEDVVVWKGALAAAGWTAPSDKRGGGSDAWLVGTSSRGVERLDRRFGGNRTDRAFSVTGTSDRGLALAGRTESFGGRDSDAWLIKTDDEGNREFSRTYGGSKFDEAVSVAQAPDGGYVLVGSTWSFGSGRNDAWLVKTDENGREEFNTTFGGPERDEATSVIRTSDGAFALAGTTESFGSGGKDAWLLKVSVNPPEEPGGEGVSVDGGLDGGGDRNGEQERDEDSEATEPSGGNGDMEDGEDADGERTGDGDGSTSGANGEDAEDDEEDVTMPGFGAVAALFGLLVAAALHRRD